MDYGYQNMMNGYAYRPPQNWSQQPQLNINQQIPQNQQNGNSGSLMTVLVHGVDEVNNYPVAAGFTVMLVDFDLKKFWLKSTSMNGVPQQPRVFSITEETSYTTPIQNEQCVTRKEFDELNEKLTKLINGLGGNE